MKYWLIQIAADDADMAAVREELHDQWEGGNPVVSDKVIGVTEFGVLDHRLTIGDKIPGEQVRHGKFATGTVGSLIDALNQIDPTGEREVKPAVTHVFADENGNVYIGTSA